jgi:Uma2 family endonuclease
MTIKEAMAERQQEAGTQGLLPLESGDRLTRPEFERRYKAMSDLKKAELIEGVVHMPSPVRASHSRSHSQVMTWLGHYWAATPGMTLHDNATVRLDMDNEVQPDALLRLDSDLGGHSAIGSDDYIEGTPELIVEIAASSASYDLHDKLNVYRRNGVQEYIVWRIFDQQLDWFKLSKGQYVPLTPDENGLIRSDIFPGLQLDITALLDGDLVRVLAGLQRGLATPEHAAFVETLSAGSA